MVPGAKAPSVLNRTQYYDTDAPKGIRDNFAILKNCSPKGIPMIVMQNTQPYIAFSRAIGIPHTRSQIIFANRETAPPPYSISFPNGKNANVANLKHCTPRGIPTTVQQQRIPEKIHDKPLKNPPKINHIQFPKQPIICLLSQDIRIFIIQQNKMAIIRLTLEFD